MKPKFALSIRQPWAWLIVNGHKDIENRKWRTDVRGRIYVHAGKGMTKKEYDYCFRIAKENDVALPSFELLQRGGIVGEVTIVDCVDQSDSPWFKGPFGFVMENAKPRRFIECDGNRRWFNPSL